MPAILVVEGRTDVVFFRELFDRAYPGSLDVVFENSEGKYQTSEVVGELLGAGVLELVVTQDIDDRTPDEAVHSIHQMICSHLSVNPTNEPPPRRKFTIADRSIGIIPVGLHNNETLREFGMTDHSLEDYLINLMLSDAGLRKNVPELGSLIPQLLPLIREKDGTFDKSKELFQLIKPLVQHGFSDTGVVEKVVKDADEDILRSVLAPLLADVEQAFGLHS